MQTYSARALAALPADQLWAIPNGPIAVEFDDGLLETNAHATIFSAYIWDFYNKYPETKTRKIHHLNQVGHGRQQMLGKDTHLEMLAIIMRDTFNDYHGRLDIQLLWKLAWDITNALYNDMTYRLEEYVTTISALDFIEVIDHPVIAQANVNAQPSQESIDHTYRLIKGVLESPKELMHNPIAHAARSGLSSMGQILQCVGPRGFVTDVDSNIFRYPIMRGFAHGLRSLYDSMVESRAAAKSLYFTKDPLQQSEYFNRKLQLLAETIESLHRMDCGSTEYLKVRLKGRDLTAFEGKYYMSDDGLKTLKLSDRHLIGEVVSFRSPLHCAHPNPDGGAPDSRGVCSICFGELALSIPRNTNLGHVSSTAMCEKVSQRVLSVKHQDDSAMMDTVELSDYERRWIKMANGEHVIKLADRLAGKAVSMVILAEEAPHLSDIGQIDEIDKVTLNRISELSEVQFQVNTKQGSESAEVIVAMDRRKSSMSHHLLAYIKKKKDSKWTLTPKGDYVIDMSDWDASEPLFELPLRHVNMVDFMKRIEAVIRSTGDNGKRIVKGQKTLRDFNNVHDAIMELYALVSSKLSINVAHLEVIVLASQVRSLRNLDYRIPLQGNATEFGTYNENMALRSLSAQMAFQNHQRIISNVRSYIVTDRPDHPLDDLLL